MPLNILRNHAELEGIRAAWRRLESRGTHPTQQFIWMKACAEIFARPGELRIVQLEEDGETIAIAPLIARQASRRWEFLGMDETQEPTDALYADARAARSLAAGLVALRVPLAMERIPEASQLPAAFENACRLRGLCIRRQAAAYPSLELRASDGEHITPLNSGRRSDLRRAERKAREMGVVSYEMLSPTPETVGTLLEQAMSVEASSWKLQAKTALVLDAVLADFYKTFTYAASEQGVLRLSFLRIGGRAAAMQLAVEAHGRLWLFKIGYDEHFARCSPGNLLLQEVIRHCAKQGLKSIDFLGTVEPWTRNWTQRETSCLMLRSYPPTLAGGVDLAQDALQAIIKKMTRRAGDRK
ncbi:MAG: GNAT family N-acetyltransferase [Elusimicrobiota bacterium]